jgi:hypothetical protein
MVDNLNAHPMWSHISKDEMPYFLFEKRNARSAHKIRKPLLSNKSGFYSGGTNMNPMKRKLQRDFPSKRKKKCLKQPTFLPFKRYNATWEIKATPWEEDSHTFPNACIFQCLVRVKKNRNQFSMVHTIASQVGPSLTCMHVPSMHGPFIGPVPRSIEPLTTTASLTRNSKRTLIYHPIRQSNSTTSSADISYPSIKNSRFYRLDGLGSSPVSRTGEERGDMNEGWSPWLIAWGGWEMGMVWWVGDVVLWYRRTT